MVDKNIKIGVLLSINFKNLYIYIILYDMIRNGIIRHQKNFLCVDKNREWYDMICKLYSVSVGGNA